MPLRGNACAFRCSASTCADISAHSHRPVRRAIFILGLLALLALAFAARCWNLRDVFVGGRIYFIEADAYSRMTRARMVADGEALVIRHHDFENFPAGTTPHTTAPLDWLIVAGKGALDLGFAVFDRGKTSVLRAQTLDLAGALVSPLLGVVACGWIAWVLGRVKSVPRSAAWAAGFFAAVSPILVHGTLLGRPDHQSLLIALLAVALAAELRLAEGFTRPWSLVSGVVWGLACWVSFYEPAVVLAVVAVFWAIADRGRFAARECRAGWIAFASIVVMSVLIEGWRLSWPDAGMREVFARWSRSIGELHHPTFALAMSWLGWLAVVAPVLLAGMALRAARSRRGTKGQAIESETVLQAAGRPAALLLALLVALAALTIWQVRWGYFLALAFALALPWIFAAMRRAWIAWPVFIVALWPVAQAWDARLFPGEEAERRRAMQRAENIALRQLAEFQRERNAGPFIAPWWLSPALAYWSGQPGVAGSSHESLAGIVDSARVYLAEKPEDAARIVRSRQVRWIVGDQAERLLGTSSQLLGVPPPRTEPLGYLLDQRRQSLPEWLIHVDWSPGYRTQSGVGQMEMFRLYRVDETKLPQ